GAAWPFPRAEILVSPRQDSQGRHRAVECDAADTAPDLKSYPPGRLPIRNLTHRGERRRGRASLKKPATPCAKAERRPNGQYPLWWTRLGGVDQARDTTRRQPRH